MSLQVEAEEQPEISEAYSVAAVPYFVFFKVISSCNSSSQERSAFFCSPLCFAPSGVFIFI